MHLILWPTMYRLMNRLMNASFLAFHRYQMDKNRLSNELFVFVTPQSFLVDKTPSKYSATTINNYYTWANLMCRMVPAPVSSHFTLSPIETIVTWSFWRFHNLKHILIG